MPTAVDDLWFALHATFAGAYAIQHELGAPNVHRAGTGMGARAFLARERTTSRQVVLKVLPDTLAARLDVGRFVREIELALAVQHPQIVSLLGAGVSGRFVYYTMPFVAGESLRQWLDASGGRLPIREAVRIASEIAGALQAAHEQGIVHRDVKPEYVFLSRQHAVITNVGVARAVHRSLKDTGHGAPNDRAPPGAQTPLGHVVGTPAYMSPEQTSATAHLDGRSDVYSLGCILYEMLTGTRPFTGTPEDMLRARCIAPPQRPGRRRKDIPLSLERVVMKALATRVDARYPTAGTLQLALFDALAQRGRRSHSLCALIASVGINRSLALVQRLGTSRIPSSSDSCDTH